MKNPNPIALAQRLEKRRKHLGSEDPRCFLCGEPDVACHERDHPVGRKRDPKLTQVVCRNCHRKLEMKRDVAGLTKNGKHKTTETPKEELKAYLLMLAENEEAKAASLRRKAEEFDQKL